MSQFLLKVFAILGLTWLNSVYFLVTSSVIFTRLILGLCSIERLALTKERFMHTKSPEDFLINFLGYTRLNLNNC